MMRIRRENPVTWDQEIIWSRKDNWSALVDQWEPLRWLGNSSGKERAYEKHVPCSWNQES